MQTQKMRNPYEIADEIIGRIKARKNPFDKITVVFHSAKIAQWFKAYYLKRGGNDILMNVEFENLSSFINRIINVNGEKDRILTIGEYREYLVRALADKAVDFPEKSYYSDGGAINGINLYEFADRLSAVIINAEFNVNADGSPFEDIENADDCPQKKIYDLANSYAEAMNGYTPLRMCEKNAGHFARPDGDVYVFDNSYITTLYLDILDKVGDRLTVFSLDDGDAAGDIGLYPAPSKLREVERLHSDICAKLFAPDSEDRVGDFVVYAPNINDYAGCIHRVFRRSGPGLPEIPFRIIGECKEKQDMISTLDLLYEIANKRFFTRYDLKRYLGSSMVMRINSVDSDDVAAFMHAIDETYTRRDGENIDDWDYLKKRLLTSMLSDGEISLTCGKTLPYADISTDDERINKLIEIIDGLLGFAKCFDGDLASMMLDGDKIGKIIDRLNNLFSSENHGEEKNYLYAEVKSEAEKLQKIFADREIPAHTFLLFLKDAPGRYSSSPADVFSGGVTFLNLDIDNIVAEKYIYVLGLSSDVFPRVESENEIDFSKGHKTVCELDRTAFKNLLKCGDIAVSYVNCDLKDDSEHFPSAVIPAVNPMPPVPLDEKRAVDELFTGRELFAKMRFDNIGGDNKKPEKPSLDTASDIPKITFGKMKNYLENSFVYKYNQILRESDDDDGNAKSEEYEPIDTNHSDKYFLVRDIILSAVKAHQIGEKWDSDSIYEKMTLEKRLPRNFEKEYFTFLYESAAEDVIDEIKDGYTEMKPFSLEIAGKNGEKRILEMSGRCFVRENDAGLSFIEPRERTDKPKSYLFPYVCALAYVAAKDGADEYSVRLKSKKEVPFTLTPAQAKETLGEIIERMVDFEKIRYMDIDFTNEKSADKLPGTISGLVDKPSDHTAWNYFADKAAITPNVDFGYNPENAKAEIAEEYEKTRNLILYYR